MAKSHYSCKVVRKRMNWAGKIDGDGKAYVERDEDGRTADDFAADCHPLPHQAGIELSDFHARGWKSDQGGRNSMQEMHGNQTKCMEFQPIKENSNFWTSIFCPGINFSCSKSLWIWWTIDPLILACLKLMTYASFSTKQLLAVLMDGNPCTNGWNSMHQNRKNVIASCFFEQSCLRQVKIQDPWQI